MLKEFISEIPAGSFVAQWRQDLPLKNTQIKALSINDDTVFAFTADNQCFWVNRATGHAQSVAKLADPVDNLYGQVTFKDRVIFPSTKQLAVFDRQGRFAYKIPLRYSASSEAVGSGRAVFLGTDHINGGCLAAIDTKEQPYELGAAWDVMTRGQVSAKPAYFELQVFVGSRDGGVYGVRAEDRVILWPDLHNGCFKTGGPILAGIKADKQGVFVASMDTKLYSIDVDTGRINWIFHSGHPLNETSTPVLTADSVYLHVPNSGVAAINKAIDKSGKSEIRSARWTVAGAVQFLAANDQLVYLRTDDNHILAVDKQTGQVKFRSAHNDFTIFATNDSATDSTLYAVTPAGRLCAIKAVNRPGVVGELVLAD
jgi:outer membrane protein assembly factor BamB